MYEDGSLQDLESEKVKNHLTILAKRLKKACLMINPSSVERPSRQIMPFAELQTVVEKEHKKLLARKVLIERRKEEQERQMLEMVCHCTLVYTMAEVLHDVSLFSSVLSLGVNYNINGERSWFSYLLRLMSLDINHLNAFNSIGKRGRVEKVEAATFDRGS